jgi:cytochrome c oxidase subunit 2
MAMQPRRRVPAVRWLAVTAIVLAAAGCTPRSVTEQGRAIYDLYNLFLYIAGQADVNLTVTAFQWSWRFTYEGTGAEVLGTPETVPEMVLPVGQRVRVKLVSADVVHSFYVPQTLFKRQAIPGTVNQFDLTFDKVGLYHGQCTQFCGLQHTDMTFRVRVVTQGEYQTWLAAAARRGQAGRPGT